MTVRRTLFALVGLTAVLALPSASLAHRAAPVRIDAPASSGRWT